jgi:hypothetical protein
LKTSANTPSVPALAESQTVFSSRSPGDVAALTKIKSNKEQLAGLYHTPFQVTIACPMCP